MPSADYIYSAVCSIFTECSHLFHLSSPLRQKYICAASNLFSPNFAILRLLFATEQCITWEPIIGYGISLGPHKVWSIRGLNWVFGCSIRWLHRFLGLAICTNIPENWTASNCTISVLACIRLALSLESSCLLNGIESSLGHGFFGPHFQRSREKVEGLLANNGIHCTQSYIMFIDH